MKYKSIRGMEDILLPDVSIWQELECRARIELESSGYREIRTPMLEDASIFVQSIGETTDIVTKEMYTFEDRKGRSLTLRPEGTAPIVRAYIEHSLDRISPIVQLYYIGPMFRSERPQKGRSRQFHQIGIEIIGSCSPQIDFEVIWRLNKLLKLFELDGFLIKLNSLGCDKDKNEFTQKLKDYLKNEKSRLCEDCNKRLEKNILRILDCKKESCRIVVRNAPDIIHSLCPDCILHFSTLKAMLTSEKIDFQVVKNLVRGLDYYTGPIFEVTHPNLGGQDALGAGGRYDNLVKEMGGPDVGACGFAIGLERILIALGDKKEKLSSRSMVVYIATLGKDAKREGFRLAEVLRKELNKDRFKVATFIDIGESSLKSQMRRANKNNAKIVVILGEEELKSGKATIRDMAKQEQVPIKLDNVVEEVIKRMGL